LNLTSPSQVKAWCIENGFHPNRNLGQNFLVDRNVREAILSVAGVTPGQRVLEIGPGLGVLTEGLLARGIHVCAVEKDTRLADRLRACVEEELAAERRDFEYDLATPLGNLELIASDALRVDWNERLRPPFDACVSNLPYSVGTRILIDLALHPLAPRSFTILVQTEVAQRFVAREGDSARGQAGIWLQLDYDVEIRLDVKPACFWPRPEVSSTVVRIDRKSLPPALTPKERQMFYALTKFCFLQRRKQLGTILRKSSEYADGVQAIRDAGIEPAIRPEDITNEQWVSLTRSLCHLRDPQP